MPLIEYIKQVLSGESGIVRQADRSSTCAGHTVDQQRIHRGESHTV